MEFRRHFRAARRPPPGFLGVCGGNRWISRGSASHASCAFDRRVRSGTAEARYELPSIVDCARQKGCPAALDVGVEIFRGGASAVAERDRLALHELVLDRSALRRAGLEAKHAGVRASTHGRDESCRSRSSAAPCGTYGLGRGSWRPGRNLASASSSWFSGVPGLGLDRGGVGTDVRLIDGGRRGDFPRSAPETEPGTVLQRVLAFDPDRSCRAATRVVKAR